MQKIKKLFLTLKQVLPNMSLNFLLALLGVLPAIFLWLVQLHIPFFANWSYFVYALVVLVLSVVSIYSLILNSERLEEFGKLCGKMLILNALLYVFLRSCGWIGPESLWLTILLFIIYLIMAIIGGFMGSVIKDIDEGATEVMP